MLKLFKDITCFVFDVDGVLTDGNLFILPDGVMARRMNIKDGFALQLAIKRGYRVLIISGGKSPEVADRLHKLGITEIWMQAEDKRAILELFMQQKGLRKEEVLYMGDDMPYLAVMQLVGLPCCPADAAEEIKELSVYTSSYKGGEGCARDVIEKVLKLNGQWSAETNIRAQ